MRRMRSRAAVSVATFAAAVFLSPAAAAAQRAVSYPATLDFGTGLIEIPTAWVSPTSGDIWLTVSGRDIPYNRPGQAPLNFASRWNTNLAVDTHWAGRFSVGVSLYSQNPDWGLFGQALLLREHAGSALPSVAVGFENLGPDTHEDRMLVGNDLVLGPNGGSMPGTAAYATHFHTAPTFYGVATKSFAVGGTGDASFTVGYGSGLFHDAGQLGSAYNDKGQIAAGLFLGGRYAFRPSPNSAIQLLAENNGWDWNAGVVGDWRGLSLGIYGTELEEGGKSPSKGPLYTIYNYTKLNVAFGYRGNLGAIAHGVVLRSHISELQREQQQLSEEVARRERRVRALEHDLGSAQTGALREVAKRRAQLDSQIREEQDAIKRAEDRLQQLQQGAPPAPAAAPTQPAPPAASDSTSTPPAR